jgi:hypothetical protein
MIARRRFFILLSLAGVLAIVLELLLIGLMYGQYAQETGFTVLVWLNLFAHSLTDILILLMLLEMDEELRRRDE